MPLTWLLILPCAGAIATALVPRSPWAKWIALGVSATVWAMSLSLVGRFDPSDGGFQGVVDHELFPAWGVRFHLGLDGISLWLVQLTTLLFPLVAAGSFDTVTKHERAFYALLLVLEAALLGTFLALDLVLFYIFWELMLVPVFFLINLWGGKDRVDASLKFVLFTLVGSLPMLIAVLWIGKVGGTYDLVRLFEDRLPPDVQFWCFLICALAFLVKVPAVPFHAWLPDAYAEAPTGVTVLLAGVLSKMGIYGLMRVCLPLFPDASQDFAPLMMLLGVVAIVHGGLAAAAQKDLKRLTAYSSLSHMGYVVLAVFALNMQALQGAVVQMVSHGVLIAALFLLVGMTQRRTGALALEGRGGLASSAPALAAAFLFVSLGAAALPGLSGFVGEVLILSALWKTQMVLTVVACLGVVLSAWYLLSAFGRVFLGEAHPDRSPHPRDLSLRETLVLAPLMVLILYIGLRPTPIMTPTEKSLQMTVLARLAPPPVMMDFAAQERRDREKKAKTPPVAPKGRRP